MDLILQKGHNNVGRVVPLVRPSSVSQWVLGPLQDLDPEDEEAEEAEMFEMAEEALPLANR